MARNAVGAVEESDSLVLGDHAPEGAGVGGADRLALVEDRRRTIEQRAIDGVAVADRPTHVRGGPTTPRRARRVEVLHRPVERHAIAAGVVHHTLGLPRRAGGVEDIEPGCVASTGTQGRGPGLRPPSRPSRGPVPASSPPPTAAAASGSPWAPCGSRSRSPGRAAACNGRCARARCRTMPSAPAWAGCRRCGSRAR